MIGKSSSKNSPEETNHICGKWNTQEKGGEFLSPLHLFSMFESFYFL